MKNLNRVLTLLGLFFATTPAAWAKVSLEASLDLRPSWTPSGSSLHTENEIGAKVLLQENLSVGYLQEFTSGLLQSESYKNVQTRDGYVRAEYNVTSDLKFEPRLILPTHVLERSRGFYGAFRPMVIYQVWNPGPFAVDLVESPILKGYSSAFYDEDGNSNANPWFENRFELIPKAAYFNRKLVVRAPLIWQWIKDSSRSHSELWINPEIIYQVTDTMSFGTSYYSANFIGTEDSVGEALRKGVVQFVVQYVL